MRCAKKDFRSMTKDQLVDLLTTVREGLFGIENSDDAISEIGEILNVTFDVNGSNMKMESGQIMSKILITSGGTKVPIDKIRDITNQSSGTFGSKIATEALKRNHDVTFMRAKGSKSPFSMEIDFNKLSQTSGRWNWYDDEPSKWEGNIKSLAKFYEQKQQNYNEVEFRDYSDYASSLEKLIKEQQPDVVILVAAVSDYEPKHIVDRKIRTQGDLTIQLQPVSKLISKIKEWKKDVILVGFKMLVGSVKQELIQAANDSIEKNGCDLVVANDWNTYLAGNPEIHLLRKRLEPKTYNKSDSILEEVILDTIEELTS